jgi:hypothetical protein
MKQGSRIIIVKENRERAKVEPKPRMATQLIAVNINRPQEGSVRFSAGPDREHDKLCISHQKRISWHISCRTHGVRRLKFCTRLGPPCRPSKFEPRSDSPRQHPRVDQLATVVRTLIFVSLYLILLNVLNGARWKGVKCCFDVPRAS